MDDRSGSISEGANHNNHQSAQTHHRSINVIELIGSDLRRFLKRQPKTFRDISLGLSKALGESIDLIGSSEAVSSESKLELLEKIFDPYMNVSWVTLDQYVKGPNPYIAYFFLREVITAYCKACDANLESASKRSARFTKLDKKIEEIFQLIGQDGELFQLAKQKCVVSPPFSRHVSLSTGVNYQADLEFVFKFDDALKGYYNDTVPSYGEVFAQFQHELLNLRANGTVIKTLKSAPGRISPRQLIFCKQLDDWFSRHLGADEHLYGVQSALATLLFDNEIDGDSLGQKLRRMRD